MSRRIEANTLSIELTNDYLLTTDNTNQLWLQSDGRFYLYNEYSNITAKTGDFDISTLVADINLTSANDITVTATNDITLDPSNDVIMTATRWVDIDSVTTYIRSASIYVGDTDYSSDDISLRCSNSLVIQNNTLDVNILAGNDITITADQDMSITATNGEISFTDDTAGGPHTLSDLLGGGGGGSLTVQDEGVTLDAAVTLINFTGSGVTASETSDHEIEVVITATGTSPWDTSGTGSVLVSGNSNSTTGNYGVIGGSTNTTTDEDDYNAMFGYNSSISNGSYNLVSGNGHVVDGASGSNDCNYNIIAGDTNSVSSTSTQCSYNAVFGYDQTITNSLFSVVSGYNHTTNTSSYNAVFGSTHNITVTSDYNLVSGKNNVLGSSSLNGVFGGQSVSNRHFLNNANYNLVTGIKTELNGSSLSDVVNTNIVCGNDVTLNARYSGETGTKSSYNIVNGSTITMSASEYNVVNGLNNNLADAEYNLVVGSVNTLQTVAGQSQSVDWNLVVGANNTVDCSSGGSDAIYNAVFGASNLIRNGRNNLIVGGSSSISGGQYNVILGGGNSVDDDIKYTLTTGESATGYQWATHTNNGGNPSTGRVQQLSNIPHSGYTSNNTPTIIYMDGDGTTEFVLRDNCSYILRSLVIANNDEDTKTWEFTITINWNGASHDYGSFGKTNLYGGLSADCDFSVTGTTLRLTVTGVTGQNIIWGAHTWGTEVDIDY